MKLQHLLFEKSLCVKTKPKAVRKKTQSYGRVLLQLDCARKVTKVLPKHAVKEHRVHAVGGVNRQLHLLETETWEANPAVNK